MTARAAKDIVQLWSEKRRTRRRSVIGQVNLAPMLDVMFNLLMFFLVATSFRLPERLLAAQIPATTGIAAQAAAVPLVPIKIYLEPAADGISTMIRVSSALQTDVTTLTIVEDFNDLFLLLDQLRNRPGITDKTPLIIAARDRTSWDQVVNAYNAAVRARFVRVVFAGWKQSQ